MAKKAGLIPSIRRPLEAIVEAGLFISPKHLTDVLGQAGE